MAWYISGDYPYNETPEISLPQWTPKMRWISDTDDYPHFSTATVPPDIPQWTPKMRWTFKYSEDGYPTFSVFLPKIDYCLPVRHLIDEICIYDMKETDFSHWGLRILTPTVCSITEELNGLYELELDHPIDSEGAWKSIIDLNIIKAQGQLFRIYRKIKSMDSSGNFSIKVNARHIFYDLNDRLLLDIRTPEYNGQGIIAFLINSAYKVDKQPMGYDFSGTSDITDTYYSEYYNNISIVSALIGAENSFVNSLGGELYRDNFEFSINKRRNHSEDSAFSIVYGRDMLAIEETVDYSDICTYLIASDNFGSVRYQWWKYENSTSAYFPHAVIKYLQFNYDDANTSIERLIRDSRAYFEAHCFPEINYTVTFANLKDTELYKDFLNLQDCNVGDTGTVYHEELGISTVQKIIKKTVDVLTGETVSIELGKLRNSFTRTPTTLNISSGNSEADKLARQLADLNKITIGTNIENIEKYVIRDIENYNISTLEGN